MTQTLIATEELKHLASSDNANELTRRLARECLANREAQPVLYASEETLAYAKEGEKSLVTWTEPMGDAVIPLFTAPPAPAVPEEMKRDPDADVFDPGFMNGWNACRAAMLAQPVSSGYKLPEGFKLVPVESTDAWAERYCELTNKHPDGGLTTYIGDGAVTITFREKSKREIDAMLAAAPEGGNG